MTGQPWRVRYAPPERPKLTVREWQPWDGPLGKLPRTRYEIERVFGRPGIGRVDRHWKRRNIVTVRDLPGVPPKWHVSLHRLAEPYFREALRRAQLSCPEYGIERVGAFVFRHMRHDVARPLSMHSYGVAIDVDSASNRSRYVSKGDGPERFSDGWRRVWPDGLPEDFVRAFESVGFAWGGDWDEDGTSLDHEYLDPMHFELRDRAR